jgi:hypothetical protein
MIKEIKNLYLDEKHTVKQIADELGISFWKVYGLMQRNNIPRRRSSEANYLHYDKCKARFFIKKNIEIKDEYLKIAGIMLYWAEGTKLRDVVDFANSDPRMIKIFLKFLREICGIAESRLRIYLYAFSDQNVEELKEYWSKLTQVPLSQFTKPYIRKVNPDLKDRRMPYGLVHVRYNDKRLLERIKAWQKDYIESFN